MIEHIWSVLCTRSIIEGSTGLLSLIDVLEEVTLGELPPLEDNKEQIIRLPVSVASLWQRKPESDPTKGTVRLSLISPHQETVKEFEYEADLSKEKQRLRTIARLDGIRFRGIGTYRFLVQIRGEKETDWREVATLPLSIKLGSPESPSSPAQ
jgi:hypothetical protein